MKELSRQDDQGNKETEQASKQPIKHIRKQLNATASTSQ